MKCSVIVATYNGEKYLWKQLNSIFKQKRQPDEVIIVDDCSQDHTVDIAKEYIRDKKLENTWKIIQNDYNKGFINNFLDAVDLVSNELIFFSDQDDVWEKDKIDIMCDIFEKDESVNVVSCAVEWIDENDQLCTPFYIRLQRSKKNKKRISLERQVRNMSSPGMATAYRSEWLKKMCKRIKKDGLTYDTPLGLYAAAEQSYCRCGKSLVRHRIHISNLSNPQFTVSGRMSHKEQHIKGREMRIAAMKSCLRYEGKNMTPRQVKNLKKEICEVEKSLIYIRNKKIMKLIFQVFSLNPMHNAVLAVLNCMVAVR